MKTKILTIPSAELPQKVNAQELREEIAAAANVPVEQVGISFVGAGTVERTMRALAPVQKVTELPDGTVEILDTFERKTITESEEIPAHVAIELPETAPGISLPDILRAHKPRFSTAEIEDQAELDRQRNNPAIRELAGRLAALENRRG